MIETKTKTEVESHRQRRATRYLCAGAYLDASFRRSILNDVLYQDHRAVAPSYSIDVVPILRHALSARRKELTRDACVTAALAIGLVINFWLVLGLLFWLYSIASFFRAVVSLVQRDLSGFALRIVGALLLWLIAMPALGKAMPELAASLATDVVIGAATGAPPVHALAVVALFIGLVGVAFLAEVVHLVNVHSTIVTTLTEHSFAPNRAPVPPPSARARLHYLQSAQYGNVTFFARHARHAPFVGCGDLEEPWLIVTPLVPAKVDLEASAVVEGPLTEQVLYAQLRRRLMTQLDPSAPGLSLKDRLFVSGLLPTGNALIDRDQAPRTVIPHDEVLHRGSESERSQMARYLTLRVSGWEGELDVTAFLYLSLRGGLLYFEFAGAILPPIRDAFREVDAFERVTGRVITRSAITSGWRVPWTLAGAPIRLLAPSVEQIRRTLGHRAELRELKQRLAFDYGAVTSVRELGSEWSANDYFHTRDSQRFLEIVERLTAEVMVEILNEHGYDTSEFERRATQYIDNSTTINADQSAVSLGGSASNVVRDRTGAARRPGSRTQPNGR